MSREMANGLVQLGFNSGWVISGDQIVLWENEQTPPTKEDIIEAAKKYVEPTPTIAEKLATVGLSVDELKSVLGL